MSRENTLTKEGFEKGEERGGDPKEEPREGKSTCRGVER